MLAGLHAVVIACGASRRRADRPRHRPLPAQSAARERFRELLGIAVDWYWEQDEEFRFTRVTESRAGAAALSPQRALGRTPWEHAGLGLDDETPTRTAPISKRTARSATC